MLWSHAKKTRRMVERLVESRMAANLAEIELLTILEEIIDAIE